MAEHQIRKQYPLDLMYVINYYFDDRFRMYDYRSNTKSTAWRKAHYTLGLYEENIKKEREELPAFNGLSGNTLSYTFDLWLRKYQVYRYNKDIVPEAESHLLRSDIDRWIKE